MLANLDQYDQMMPGFKEQAKEIASSPEKWKEAMLQAKEQITNLKKQRDAMGSSGERWGGVGPSSSKATGLILTVMERIEETEIFCTNLCSP